MIKNKSYVMMAVLGTVVVGGVIASQVFADEAKTSFFGRNYSPERHEAVSKAIENNDYKSWKELMNGKRMAEIINEENFSKFAEMRKLRLEGKIEEANKLRQEIGVRAINGGGRGMHGGNGNIENRGQNSGGNFVDKNGDGKCDRL